MTVSTIPVQSGTDAFALEVELSGVIYRLTLLWNARDAHWAMTVAAGGVDLVAGIKLVVSDDLLHYARRISGLPAGRLQIVDVDGKDRDPDDSLFGDRVVLRYDDAEL